MDTAEIYHIMASENFWIHPCVLLLMWKWWSSRSYVFESSWFLGLSNKCMCLCMQHKNC